MAAFIPAVDCIKVVMHYTWLNQQVKNVMYFQNSAPGSWTAAQRNAFLDNLVIWHNTHLKVQVAPQCALNAVEAINQESVSAPSTLRAISPPVPGTSASAGIALNSTLAVSLRTDLRGRNFRGRQYMVGMPEIARFDAGTVSQAYASSVAAAYAQLLNVALFTNGKLVVASKRTANVPRLQALLTPVTAFIVETLMDSMRRRLVGRGA